VTAVVHIYTFGQSLSRLQPAFHSSEPFDLDGNTLTPHKVAGKVLAHRHRIYTRVEDWQIVREYRVKDDVKTPYQVVFILQHKADRQKFDIEQYVQHFDSSWYLSPVSHN